MQLLDNYHKYLPKGREVSLDKPKQEKELARSKMKKYENKFHEYLENYGAEKCPYLERVHGEDISLMTEIVYGNNRKRLFEEDEERFDKDSN